MVLRPPGRPSAAAVFLSVVLVLGAPAHALAADASTPDAAPAPVLEPDERILRPDADIAVGGFTPGPGSESPDGELHRLLADGEPGGIDGDATSISAPARGATYRAAFEAAPSGVVTSVSVAVRVRAVDGPVDLRIVVLEGQDVVLEGPARRLEPAADGAWLGLVEPFPGAVVASARALRVELSVTSPTGTAGRADIASLAVRVRLQVSLRPVDSALVGGARMTAIAWGRGGSVTVGSATGGLARAMGTARPFRAQNADLTRPDWMRIASVGPHPGRPGTLYAAAGDRGERNALLRSTDDGRTWRVLSGQPSFSAAPLAGQVEMALPIGTLLALADAPDGTTTIWAATIRDGLMRSTDGGVTWRSLGLSGQVLVGLAMHPDDPGTLLLATRGAGVWRVTGAWSEAPVFRTVPGGPAAPEELAWVGDELWVAGGTEGLFRLDGEGLVPVNDGVPLDGPAWSTIAGVVVDGLRVVVAGCGPCATASGGATSGGAMSGLLRSIDGGPWESISDPASVATDLVGSGDPWQLAEALAAQAPGGSAFAARHLVVRPARGRTPDTPSPPPTAVPTASSLPSGAAAPASSPALGAGQGSPSAPPPAPAPIPVEILVAADGAVWRSGDGGARWAPMVDGLGGRSMRTAVADPAQPGTVVVSAAGIGTLVSTDRLETLAVEAWTDAGLPAMRAPVAMDVAFDGQPGDAERVVVAVGDTARAPAGEVLTGLGSGADAAWSPTGFATDLAGTRPVAVAAGRDGTGARVLLAAAHPAGGIVRRVGDGPWVPALAGEAMTDPEGPPRADLAWVGGSSVVYLFDPASGIHRSTDAGLTWSRVWGIRTDRQGSGRIAVGSDPSVVYASTNQGVFRLDGADAGTVEDGSVRRTQLGTFRKPGPITLDEHGRLWVASGILPGSPARLSVAWDPWELEPTFWELAGERYVNAMTEPDSIAVLGDGSVVVADDLGGTMLLAPARRVIAPWLPAYIVLDPVDRTEGAPMVLQPTDPAVVAPLVEPVVIVVSADGDDGAPGTPQEPVATLEGAQAVLVARFGANAERLDHDVLVQVRSGRYEGQRVRWTFTHPEHIVRIEGVPSATSRSKPVFVGCVPGSCVTTRAWFELAATPGAPTNLQLVNLQAVQYHRGVILAGGDPETGWNGRNVLHRLDMVNIGTRFREDVTPEVWSAGVFLLQASRDTRIVGNRVWHSANRMRHANPWFHTVYASHGSTGTLIRGNLVVDTSGDFHVRNGSDGGEIRGNVLVGSFLSAIVTEWSAPDETDVCDTRVSGNLAIGDWDGGPSLVPWHRETPSPDGRCAVTGRPDVVASDNMILPGRRASTP